MSQCAFEAVEINTQPNPSYINDVCEFQGIPGVEISAKGKLWATWYAGGKGEGPENYVLLVSSSDGGKTWSPPITVIDPPENVRAYDPCLWMDPEHRLWLFWAQCRSQKNGNIFDGVAGVWGICTEDPESDSPSWSRPQRIANGVMMNKPTVLSNGEWAFPCAVWNDLGGASVPQEFQHEKRSNMVVSNDKGKSFSLRAGADTPYRSFDEHMLVEFKDKSLGLYVRTEYGIALSISMDGGSNWSLGRPSGKFGPNTRFFIRRLQSGKLLLVYHDIDSLKLESYPRDKMMAYLSDDDGVTWKGGLMLDERGDVSYPDGTQDAEGNIWIIHDFDRYKHGHILLSRIREEDILAGELVSPKAALRMIVGSMS